MQKLLKIAILVNAALNAGITVYPEHNPVDNDFDYLHVYIDEIDKNTKDVSNTEKKSPDQKNTANDVSNSKIIYKIPKLDHDETFTLKICPKGTIDKLNSNSEKTTNILKGCLNDNYGSLLGFNNYSEISLYQYSMYTFYKACFFNGSGSEAERSLINVSAQDIIENKTFEDKKLFFTESEEIMQRYENSKSVNYRLKYSDLKGKNFRCSLDFNKNDGFNIKNFEDKVHYIKNEGSASTLILEYSNKKLIKKEKSTVPSNEFPDADIENRDITRQRIVNALKASIRFEKSSFINSKINYKIVNDSNKKSIFEIESKTISGSSKTNFPISLKKNEYVRFISIVCKFVLEDDVESTSYMFLSSKDCAKADKNKHVIRYNNGKHEFVKANEGKEVATDNIEVEVLTMDFKFYPKNSPNNIYEIEGFVDKSDIFYDEENKIIYHVSYQKTKVTEDGKNKEIQPKKETKIVPLKMNGKDKTRQRLLGQLDRAQVAFLGIALIFAGLALGALFMYEATTFAFIAILVIILCLFIVAYRNEYRILSEDNEITYGESFVNYMKKENIELHQKRIQDLSKVTVSLFKDMDGSNDTVKKVKGKNRIVVDIEAFNNLLKISDKKINDEKGVGDFKPELQEKILKQKDENLAEEKNLDENNKI